MIIREHPDSLNPPHSLIFLKPNLETLDFFDLLWIVGIADFVLKYITIALKCLIVALPKIILAVKSKVGTGCSPQAAPITHAGDPGHALEEERVGLGRANVIIANGQSLSRQVLSLSSYSASKLSLVLWCQHLPVPPLLQVHFLSLMVQSCPGWVQFSSEFRLRKERQHVDMPWLCFSQGRMAHRSFDAFWHQEHDL